jgi:serine/threonine protein kinase
MWEESTHRAILPSTASVSDPHTIICPAKIGSYFLRDRIGEGAFAEVRLAVHEETGESYACKIIPKKRLYQLGIADQLENEISIMCNLTHPGVCAVHDIYSDTINSYVILDLYQHGNLLERIKAAGRLDEHQAQDIFKQIVRAIHYVHDHGVAHRDIKPENVLLAPGGRVTIIDFGLSVRVQPGECISSKFGSAIYAAPECFNPHAFDPFKADIWSCGIVLFAMLNGRVPWERGTPTAIIETIASGDVTLSDEFMSPKAVNLLSRILKKDPLERISLKGILEHEWLAAVQDPMMLPRPHHMGAASMPSLAMTPTPQFASAKRLIALGRSRLDTKRASASRVFRDNSLPGIACTPLLTFAPL